MIGAASGFSATCRAMSSSAIASMRAQSISRTACSAISGVTFTYLPAIPAPPSGWPPEPPAGHPNRDDPADAAAHRVNATEEAPPDRTESPHPDLAAVGPGILFLPDHGLEDHSAGTQRDAVFGDVRGVLRRPVALASSCARHTISVAQFINF